MPFDLNFDYSAEITKRKKLNPNADVSDLVAARNEKIAANPEKYKSFVSTDNLLASLTPKKPDTVVTAPKEELPAPPPVYKSKYEPKISAILDKIGNKAPFAYNPLTDPNYAIAQKEGGKIFENQIGSMSAATGGRLNSWATSSAAQAQNEYMGDSMARLEGNAYNRYQAENKDLLDQLGIYTSLDSAEYGKFRDTVGDTRYTDETKYNRGRDTVADTGKLPDGTYTQTGLKNKLDIERMQTENKELSDPNSYRNKMNSLGLKTAEINLNMLDKTQQAQIDLVLADLSGKKISNEMAQAQVKEITDPKSVTNQFKKYQLDTAKLDYQFKSKTQQAEIDGVLLDLETKKINKEEAQYRLNEIKDPNSVTNKKKAIELKIAEIDLKNLPEESRLRIEQMKKTIAQIGKVQPKDAQEQALLDYQVKKAEADLAQTLWENGNLKVGLNKDGTPKVDTKTTNTVDDYASTINRIYVTPPNSDNSYTASVDKAGIAAYIKNLEDSGVDEKIIDALLLKFGLITGK